MRMMPSPRQASQRPPLTLKENRPGLYPRSFDSGRLANKRSDGRKQVGVGGRVRAGRATDGRLIDIDDFIQIFEPFDGIVTAWFFARPIHALGDSPIQRVDHQGRFAGSADTCDYDQFSQRETHIQMFEIILTGAAQDQVIAIAGTPFFGCLNLDGGPTGMRRSGCFRQPVTSWGVP